MVRFSVYCAASTLVAAITVQCVPGPRTLRRARPGSPRPSPHRQAYDSRRQFYPTVVYLATSKVSIVVMANLALVAMVALGHVAKKTFFGRLREAEVELLHENARYAITETCLALTTFREELTMRVAALFTALLFAKAFHWLAQSRIEHIETAEAVRAENARLAAAAAATAGAPLDLPLLPLRRRPVGSPPHHSYSYSLPSPLRYPASPTSASRRSCCACSGSTS